MSKVATWIRYLCFGLITRFLRGKETLGQCADVPVRLCRDPCALCSDGFCSGATVSLLVATGRQTVLLVARKGFPHLEFRVRQIFVKLIGEFQHFSKKGTMSMLWNWQLRKVDACWITVGKWVKEEVYTRVFIQMGKSNMDEWQNARAGVYTGDRFRKRVDQCAVGR